MRLFPHPVLPGNLAAAGGVVREFLKHRKDAGQLRLRACLEYAEERPLSGVLATLREAVQEFAGELEGGLRPSPWDLWHWSLAALAARDREAAEFFSTTPENRWLAPLDESAQWLHAQVLALFSLLRHDETETRRWVEALPEFPLPDGVADDVPEIRNVHHLLDAIHRRDGTAFHARLAERMELRAKSFARIGRDSLLGCLDIEGLGLCALARERGIVPAVAHVYLPLL